MKVIFHANENPNSAGVAIVISDKIDLESKSVTQDKGGPSIVVKEPINQEGKIILNIYVPNIEHQNI